jgi:hypothetical protein
MFQLQSGETTVCLRVGGMLGAAAAEVKSTRKTLAQQNFFFFFQLIPLLVQRLSTLLLFSFTSLKQKKGEREKELRLASETFFFLNFFPPFCLYLS